MSWAPAMQLPKRLHGAETDLIVQCQNLCASTKSCAHFTMEVGTGTCQLATGSAIAVPAVFNSISGPPSCRSGAEPADMFLQRKFSRGHVGWSLVSRISLMVLAATSVAFAGLALAAVHFWRRAA